MTHLTLLDQFILLAKILFGLNFVDIELLKMIYCTISKDVFWEER